MFAPYSPRRVAQGLSNDARTEEEDAMSMSEIRRARTLRAWAGPVAALALVAALIGVGIEHGHTADGRPLWTERTTETAPVMTSAPNWVLIARELKPAVVNIDTRRSAPKNSGLPPELERFMTPRAPRIQRGVGSGFVISADGHIVTNNHVVDGASDIKVTLADGRELPARVLGRDPKTDLALLKIDATGLPVIPLGDSSRLEVGEPVMAIGNPFGLEQTVTTGIVSATARFIGEGPYDDFIQTDASINPGNSGGPLINARGQAVGINSAIFSRSGGSDGIGFSIPVNLAKSVVTQLAENGTVTRGFLGVTVQRVTPDLAKSFGLSGAGGALVADVTPGSPAALAGVKRGDVIVEFDGRPVTRMDELPRAVAATPVGRKISLTVVRDGKRVTLDAAITRLAEDEPRTTAASQERGRLGVGVQPLTPDLARELGIEPGRGVVVSSVDESGPAASAGIRPGDVVVEVNHRVVTTVDELRQAVDRHTGGGPLLFLIRRDGSNLYLTVPA
jgi:serine protease Do